MNEYRNRHSHGFGVLAASFFKRFPPHRSCIQVSSVLNPEELVTPPDPKEIKIPTLPQQIPNTTEAWEEAHKSVHRVWGYTCMDRANTESFEACERTITKFFERHYKPLGGWVLENCFRDDPHVSHARWEKRPGANDLYRATKHGDVVLIARRKTSFKNPADCYYHACKFWNHKRVTVIIIDIGVNTAKEVWRSWLKEVTVWRNDEYHASKTPKWRGPPPYGFKQATGDGRKGKLVPWPEMRMTAQYVIELQKRGLDLKSTLKWLQKHMPVTLTGKPWTAVYLHQLRMREMRLQKLEAAGELPWENCILKPRQSSPARDPQPEHDVAE